MYFKMVTRTRRYSTPLVEVAPAPQEEEEGLLEGSPILCSSLLRGLQMGRLSEKERYFEDVVMTDCDLQGNEGGRR
jgi:hypothetical protein